MRHVLNDGTTSAPLTFKTGALPANLTFPIFTVLRAPSRGTDLTQDIVFHVGDRDRGEPRGSSPPTPPGIRVRTTAVRSD
jgi:hypothetical protein